MEHWSIVLVEPRYDGNVGSVARVMRNFGFENLVLVKPPTLGKEARKMSMHARELLDEAIVYPTFAAMRKDFDFLVGTTAKAAGDRNPGRRTIPLTQLKPRTSGRIALLFGREDYGLKNNELSACDVHVTIPANPAYPTLNLAQSVAVVCYELAKKRMEGKLAAQKFKAAEAPEKSVLLERFDAVVDHLYDHDYENRLIKKTFRHLLGRAFVSGREVYNLIGFIRKIENRLT